MLVDILRPPVRILLKLLYRIEYLERERIPKSGSLIICANHSSYIDPFLLGAMCDRPIYFMAKKELFHIPILAWLVRILNGFPVDRDNPDRKAIRESIELLKEGKILGLFPEGTRYKDGKLGRVYHGVSLIALKTGVSILPVAILGANKIMPPGAKLPRFPKIRMKAGQLIRVDDLKRDKGDKRSLLVKITDLIMGELERLLSEMRVL